MHIRVWSDGDDGDSDVGDDDNGNGDDRNGDGVGDCDHNTKST